MILSEKKTDFSRKTGATMPQRFLFLLLRVLLLRFFSIPSMPQRPRHVLVIRPDDRLGNPVLTAPLLATLREAYPEARLSFLCAARHAWLFADNALGVEIIPFDKRWLFRKPWRWFGLMVELLLRRFDVVVDASHAHAVSTTSGALCLLAGNSVRIGPQRGPHTLLYTHAVPIIENDRRHESQRKLDLLSPLGISLPNEPAFWLGSRPDEVRQRAAEVWRDLGLDGLHVAACFLGARKEDRRPAQGFWQEMLLGFGPPAGWRVLLLYGRESRQLAEVLSRDLGNRVVLGPDCDVLYLAEFLGRSAFVVAPDTGPLHLAHALGKETLSLLTVEDEGRWAYRTLGSAVVHPCTPDKVGQAVAAMCTLARQAEAASESQTVAGEGP